MNAVPPLIVEPTRIIANWCASLVVLLPTLGCTKETIPSSPPLTSVAAIESVLELPPLEFSLTENPVRELRVGHFPGGSIHLFGPVNAIEELAILLSLNEEKLSENLPYLRAIFGIVVPRWDDSDVDTFLLTTVNMPGRLEVTTSVDGVRIIGMTINKQVLHVSFKNTL